MCPPVAPITIALLLFSALAFAVAPESGGLKEDATAKPLRHQSPEGDEGVGEEIKDFSEEVALRIDRIVKKKSFDLWGDPWTIQGIPLIFPSSRDGFNLGLRAALQNIRRQDPHKFEMEAQVLASDLGRYKHFVKLDYPRAFDSRFRITTRLAYDRDISFRYYGISNDTVVDQSKLNAGNTFYDNTRAGPSFTVSLLRSFDRYLSIGPILGLKWTEVSAPAGSLLAQQNPVGITGGRTHYIGLALIHDTTDFEPYPSRGRSHELFTYWYAPFMGSDYDFVRVTYTYRHYVPLHRKLVFAARGLFEVLGGDVPFYEMGATGGLRPSLGLGGDKFLRGYDNNRFIDRIRLIAGFELRWDPVQFEFSKQEITLGFVPFVDVGRVWPRFFPLELGDWHASAGWGWRLIWNNRFVIRSDIALNKDGVSFVFELGNSF